MKLKLLIAAMSLMIPNVSLAQEPPPSGPPREGRPLQNTIEWLLTQKEQFRPSGEQVAQLEAAAKALNDSIARDRDEIRKLREESRAGNGDRSATFQKMRPLMDAIHKQDESATQEALKVLNGEQQKVVQELLEARRKEMDARRRGFGAGASQ